ncbi:hypothetical protein FIBSPDRAFT_1048999 [Athelia psychrophila]|uniref:Uncharacterized protein n=1 Tax=Athelia psychrophila TaxID=1759441 RepID=A0A166CV83_9AGAM|nr:hypothetical protein FIBSPDRAFT_1048999 [Fibularhizoctonia sp. CBS 109695]
MEEHPMLLLSRPILDASSCDDEFNPHDLIDQSPEKYSSENSLNEQSVRTSGAGTTSKGRVFAAGILEQFQDCTIPFAVRLPALLVAFVTLFLSLSVMLWLSHRHYDPPKGFIQAKVPSGILVREPTSQGDSNTNETVAVGLIISSVATQFVALTAPFLLGTVAYRLGFDWCKASQELAYEKLPTQDQYGLIIDMFTVASIPTMWRTSSYLLQRTVCRTKAPLMLLRGFCILCILLALTQSIRLADVVLHSTTSSIILQAVNNLPTNGTGYGTATNQSAVTQRSSGIIQNEGVLTAANLSVINRVFTLDNQSNQPRMAYIARLSTDVPTDVSFIAPSLGVESSCVPITAACLSQSVLTHLGDYAAYNCSSAGYPDYQWQAGEVQEIMPTLSVLSKYVSNPNINGIISSINQNPFPALYINIIAGACTSQDLCSASLHGSYVFLACNISVYDTVLQYSQGAYTMLNSTLSTPEIASVVTQPMAVYGNHDSAMNVPLATTLAETIQYLIATDQALGNSVTEDLSRLLLSYSAGQLISIPAHAVANSGVITRYNTTSLAITLLLITLYSLLAFIVFGWACTAHIEPFSHLRLPSQKQSHVVSTQGLVYNAQLRLTRPSTLVPQALYGWSAEHLRHNIPPCPAGYVVDNEVELFEGLDGKHCDRLDIAWERTSKGTRDVKTRMCAVGHDLDEEGTPPSQAAAQYQTASAVIGVESSSSTFSGAEFLRTHSKTSAADIPEVSNSYRQYHIPVSGRFPALMVFLGSSVLATSMICWLSIRRYRALDSGMTSPLYPRITVKEPSRSSAIDPDGTVLVGLLISSITFVTLTAPLLLVAVACRVSTDWLKYSGRMNFTKLPTTRQYGHLLNLFSVGGLGMLLEIGGYLKDRNNRAQAPGMLLGALLASIVFLLTRIIELADLALHSTTTTGTLHSVNIMDPLESVYYGTIPIPFDPNPFNDTVAYGITGPEASRVEGMLTANNRSAVNSILTLDSDGPMAYITRIQDFIPAGVSFIAPSLGVSAQCAILPVYCPPDCPQNCPISDCTAPLVTSQVPFQSFVVLGDQWSGSDVKNPLQAFWQFNTGGVDHTAGLVNGSNIYNNNIMTACNVTVYDIFLHYTDGSYTLVNKTVASDATAAYATYPLASRYVVNQTEVLNELDQLCPIIPRLRNDFVKMNPSPANYSATFSPDVAHLLLAFSAGVLQSAPAAQVMTDGIVTRYPFIPLLIYFLFVYLYALLALGIFVWAAFPGRPFAGTTGFKKQVGRNILASDFGSAPGDENPGQAHELGIKARWHISQPSSLVAALFGGTRKEERKHNVDDDVWGEHMDEKRLAVGLHEQTEEDGSNQRLVYGVWEVQGFKEAKEH